MDDRKNFSDILEQSDDQAFQAIIDRQETALAKAECASTGPALTKETLEKWENALDELPDPPEGYCGRRKLRRMAMIAAIIMALLLLAAGASAFHVQLLNWWEQIWEETSIIHVEEDPEAVIQTWKGFYAPTAVPEDFQAARAINGTTAKIIEYRDAAGSRILFYQYTADASLGLDKEHADTLNAQDREDIGTDGNGNETNYYWFVEDRAYLIVFNAEDVTVDAVEQMAKSLCPIT